MNDNDMEESIAPENVAEQDVEVSRLPDASRLSRLLAQILDGIILMFASIPTSMFLNIGSGVDWEEVLATGEFPIAEALQITAVGIFLYILINSYHLWYFGQSLGKK